ncbi:MAG: alpha-ketoglutarate-dependent dioxygenase AlkB [Enterobacterales bacterium]|nr:alpha-ketoglutarate-dependent dioxygenase AlkB [Enterobacterales bacterium]
MDLFSHQQTNILPFRLPNLPGYASEWDDERKGFLLSVPNGKLFFSPCFFSYKISERSMEYFLENSEVLEPTIDWRNVFTKSINEVNFTNIKWHQDEIEMYGKTRLLPRISAWHGDNDKKYTYSGITLFPSPWNNGLNFIKMQIEKLFEHRFNSVLLNWYRDGHDHIGWHTDEEEELGINPTIASVNFGAERDFIIRHNYSKQKLSIPLSHGSLLIMMGELQHHWQHSVPKRTKVIDSRINLTFRYIRK